MSPCPVETLVISIPISAYWRVPVYSLFMCVLNSNQSTGHFALLQLFILRWPTTPEMMSTVSHVSAFSICTSSTKNPKLHWESYLFSMILTSIGRYTVVTAANTPFPTSKNNPSLNTNHAINIHKSRNDKSKRMQVMNDPTSNPP